MRLFNNWINGDCLKELKRMEAESVDLVITSPPYHNLRVYSNDPSDLSNCESYEEYYYLLGLVIAECERVLKPGGKFVMQFEDYNYTIGRDNKMGQESLTGDINKIFLDNGFSLWTKAFWRKYSAQRAMLAQGNLYYRNMKARDTILAANVGFVYVYKKAGDCELIKASDITLAEWADWADGVWNISNSGIGHAQKLDLSTSNGHYDYEFEPVKMNFNPKSNNFYDFSIEDFSLENYNPIKPQLKLELGV